MSARESGEDDGTGSGWDIHCLKWLLNMKKMIFIEGPEATGEDGDGRPAQWGLEGLKIHLTLSVRPSSRFLTLALLLVSLSGSFSSIFPSAKIRLAGGRAGGERASGRAGCKG